MGKAFELKVRLGEWIINGEFKFELVKRYDFLTHEMSLTINPYYADRCGIFPQLKEKCEIIITQNGRDISLFKGEISSLENWEICRELGISFSPIVSKQLEQSFVKQQASDLMRYLYRESVLNAENRSFEEYHFFGTTHSCIDNLCREMGISYCLRRDEKLYLGSVAKAKTVDVTKDVQKSNLGSLEWTSFVDIELGDKIVFNTAVLRVVELQYFFGEQLRTIAKFEKE